MKTLEAVPAYGRRYTTLTDMLLDWNAGMDFKVAGGPYFSRRDLDKLRADGYTSVSVTYNLRGSVHVIDI